MTHIFAEANPPYVELSGESAAKIKAIQDFGCHSPLVAAFAKAFLGYEYVQPKVSYTFNKGAVVVPIQHTKREAFASDEAYAEALAVEQAKTSYKLGNPAIINCESGNAIFSTTGNVGNSLPKDYKAGDLRAATDTEIDVLLEQLAAITDPDKAGLDNLIALLD